jgi:hypothetical protein
MIKAFQNGYMNKKVCSNENFSQYCGYTNLKTSITYWVGNHFSNSSLALIITSKHWVKLHYEHQKNVVTNIVFQQLSPSQCKKDFS